MIDMEYIRGFYPPYIVQNAGMQKHMLKEYVELLALEWIARSPYAAKLVFIGGTNLRLIQGIDRFSEDLDFDCKGLSESEFCHMTDELVKYLQLQGLNAELRNKENALFDLQLTGHREERFLMKIEAQEQEVDYAREMAIVQRNGFSFPVPVPSLSVLLSMKLCALLTRQKGRDFYDAMFLMQRTEPDYTFLQQKKGIANREQLEDALREVMEKTDMKMKQRDFEHLLFDSRKSETILRFGVNK